MVASKIAERIPLGTLEELRLRKELHHQLAWAKALFETNADPTEPVRAPFIARNVGWVVDGWVVLGFLGIGLELRFGQRPRDAERIRCPDGKDAEPRALGKLRHRTSGQLKVRRLRMFAPAIEGGVRQVHIDDTIAAER